MSYIPLAMNAATAASSSASGSTTNYLYQAADVGDKILVLWPTKTRYSTAVYGSTTGFTVPTVSNCTVGTIRNVYNGQDRHYFCWITITGSSWSFSARETSYYNFEMGSITYHHYQSCSNNSGATTKVPTFSQGNIAASRLSTEWNGGSYPVVLSDYLEGGKVANTDMHQGLPEKSSAGVSYSQLGGRAALRTGTETGGNNSLSQLASLVFTAGNITTTTETGGGKGGTIYTHNVTHGYANSSSGYLSNGSVTDNSRISGFGDHQWTNDANFSRIAMTAYQTGSTSSTAPNPDSFHIRMHTNENSSDFAGSGRSSTGSGSGSSTVAGWEQLFIVCVNDDVAQYHMLDIDDATVTNYTNSGNDYSDMNWSSGTSLTSGREYIMMFLKWDV